MQMFNSYDTFDEAFTDITRMSETQQKLTQLKSQLCLARTTITRLVQDYTAFESTINRIYCTPLPDHDVADIFVTYNECAQQPTKKRVRKLSKKRAGITSETESTEAWPQHEPHSTPEEDEPHRLSPIWDSSWLEVDWYSGMPSSPAYINRPSWA